MSEARNVLFMIADDWSPLAACYGNSVVRTPHIDQFAKRATVFDYGFCTSPSCAVSRACILTGQYSHTHGQYGHSHGIHGFRAHESLQKRTLPALMNAAGYATASIGKRHFAPDFVFPFQEDHSNVNARNPYDMAARAKDFILRHPDQPFYLHMGSFDPHRSGGGFGNEHSYEGVEEQVYSPDEVVVPPWLPDIPEVRADIADYYQAVSRYDLFIGETLKVLEETGHLDDTLVFVTTDHAMPFPGAKASSFDSGHRCPLLIHAPGVTSTELHSQALVNWQDFMPTILEWAGVDAPDDLPGRSLMPVLAEELPEGWDETWFSHNFHEVTNYYPYRVLRQRQFKYVLNLAHELPMPLPTDLFRSKTWQGTLKHQVTMMGQRPTERVIHHDHEELYDMEADPTESRNLISEPSLQPMLAEMREKMTAWRIETRDPWLELSFQHGDIDEDPSKYRIG